jgi:hypothetical protein
MKKRKTLAERYEDARRAWAERGGWFNRQKLRYWEWRYRGAPVGRLMKEAAERE